MNRYVKIGIATTAAFVLVVGIAIGGWLGVKSIHRHQVLADARNQTQVNNIKIAQTRQLVQVAQQQAAIRYANAVGVREAQDEIAKTLTPLYVQFEMVNALQAIAESGKNNTVVYIPSGANGIPLVSGIAGSQAVGAPNGK